MEIIKTNFGEVKLIENENGLGYNLFLNDQLMEKYYGDSTDVKEIEDFLKELFNKGKQSTEELRKIDGIDSIKISYITISEQIDKWVKKYLKPSFVFRKFQKEIIIDIISNIVNDENKNHNHMV